MKEGWTENTIQNICDQFTDGNWIETKDQSSEGIRLIQTGNIGQAEFKSRLDKARFVSEETFEVLGCTEVLSGDLLISRLPDPVGRCTIVPDLNTKAITAVDCSILRLDHGRILPQFFIYYSLSRSYLREVNQACTGTTRRRISRKNLGKVHVPLPPLEEQQAIVDILDEAFAGLEKARANTEANLESAGELFQSTLTLFLGKDQQKGTAFVSIEDCTKAVRIATKVPKKQYLDQGEFPIVSQEDELVSGFWNNKSDVTEVTDAIVVYGDHTQVVKYVDFNFVAGADGIKPLEPVEEMKAKYLYYAMAANKVPSLGYARHFRHMKKVKIPFLSPDEQAIIVSSLSSLQVEIDRLREEYKRQLNDLDELKQSLLQKAFAGELS